MIKKPIHWYGPDDFKGRTIRTTSSSVKGRETHIREETVHVPDDQIICDLCNAKISRFPVCVLGGKAYCPECTKRWGIEPGDEEYFETQGYLLGEVDPGVPRVDYGGRKKAP